MSADAGDIAAERAAQQRRVWRQRTRKFLKRLPRRSNVTRYPVIKYWGESAKKRSYLWSWKRPHTITAYYIGWIVTLLPLGGIQIAVAAALSIAFKANLTIAAALQFVSNPITAAPIYLLTYFVGKGLLSPLGVVPSGIVSGTAIYLLVGGIATGVVLGCLSHLLHHWLIAGRNRAAATS